MTWSSYYIWTVNRQAKNIFSCIFIFFLPLLILISRKEWIFQLQSYKLIWCFYFVAVNNFGIHRCDVSSAKVRMYQQRTSYQWQTRIQRRKFVSQLFILYTHWFADPCWWFFNFFFRELLTRTMPDLLTYLVKNCINNTMGQ